jgi:hypothetical protein
MSDNDFKRVNKGIVISPFDSGPNPQVADPTDSIEGSLWVFDDKIKTHVEAADREVVTNTQTQTLTNKTIGDTNTIAAQDDAFSIQDAADATLEIDFDAAGTTGTKTTITSSQTANRVITVPDATDTLVGKATTDTLTNKTIGDTNTIAAQDDAFSIQDAADATLEIDFNAAGTTGTKTTVTSSQTANRVVTIPNATDTLVGKATTDTLTNKTFDADGTGNSITNIENADIKAAAAIDAAKIHDASVSNTEFGHLNGVTSAIQTQLDAAVTVTGLTDNRLMKADGTTDIQDSGITVSDLDDITGVNDLTMGGDLIVTGDLTVNGTTTTINTTNMDVTDKNITLNDTGNDASSEGAGLTVERTGTDGSLVYEDVLASKFKIGALAAEKEVADVSSTQTFTNKTLTSPVINTPTGIVKGDVGLGNVDNTSDATKDAAVATLTNKTLTAPVVNSPTGIVKGDVGLGNVDNTSDVTKNAAAVTLTNKTITAVANTITIGADDLSDIDTTTAAPNVAEVLTWDGSNWVPGEGGGGGQGGINYIKNTDFEVDSADVTVTGNITKALETTDPLRGTQSLKLTIGTGATTADFVDFSMDDVDAIDVEGSKILPISFEYFTDANFTTNDVQFVLRRLDATAADIPLIDELDGKILSSSGKVKFHSRVQLDDDANTYALRMKVLSAPSVASKITIDSMKIGPDEVVPGHISAFLGTYVPVITGSTTNPTLGTVFTNLAYIWRDGEFLVVAYTYQQTTAGTAGSGRYQFSLPPGLAINTVKQWVGTNGTREIMEGAASSSDTANGAATGHAVALDSTNFGLIVADDVGAPQFVGTTGSAYGSFGNVGSTVSVRFRVPIDGWEPTASLSTSEFGIQTIFTKTESVQAPTGTISGTFNVTKFSSVTDKFSLYNESTGQWVAARTGEIDVNAFIEISFTSATSRTVGIRILNTTTGESVIGSISSTGATTRLVPEISGMLSVTRGDIVEVQGLSTGASPSYTSSTTGSKFSIAYRPDFSVFSVFGTSELIEASATSQTYTTAASFWGDLTSIELSPGTWDITSQAVYRSNGATTTGGVLIGINNVAGNVSAGSEGIEYVFTEKGTTSGDRDSLFVDRRGIVVTSTETYYLKAFAETSTTNLFVSYKISARRIQ